MATNTSATTYENTTLVETTSILDVDVGTGLTVTSVPIPTTNGSVAVNPDGTYIYIPNTDFVGMDSFTYVCTSTNLDCMGQPLTASANVLITVLPFPSPTNFAVQRITKCKFPDKTLYKANITWSPVDLPTVVAYIIYLDGTEVARIPVGDPLTFQWCAKSKSVFNGFTITALYANGTQSPPVPIKIVTQGALTGSPAIVMQGALTDSPAIVKQ
jgi:hypothetical protein